MDEAGGGGRKGGGRTSTCHPNERSTGGTHRTTLTHEKTLALSTELPYPTTVRECYTRKAVRIPVKTAALLAGEEASNIRGTLVVEPGTGQRRLGVAVVLYLRNEPYNDKWNQLATNGKNKPI